VPEQQQLAALHAQRHVEVEHRDRVREVVPRRVDADRVVQMHSDGRLKVLAGRHCDDALRRDDHAVEHERIGCRVRDRVDVLLQKAPPVVAGEP
jgi:hypothetical protein